MEEESNETAFPNMQNLAELNNTNMPKETDATPKFQTFTCKRCQKQMTFPYDPSEEFIEQPTCAACTSKMNKSFEESDEKPKWQDYNFKAKNTYGYYDAEASQK